MADLVITGVYGQLGRAVEREARRRGLDPIGYDLDTLDIRNASAVDAAVAGCRPATVINCAAMTAVDQCEHDPTTAMAVNGEAVGHLAAACNRAMARLVHVSTDYVFSGTGQRPYLEHDPTGPINSYGRSKLAGERLATGADRHLIVRTSWLFGHGGSNFVEAIRRQLDAGTTALRVVADQVGSPTYCEDLAAALLDLDAHGATGIVHACNSGVTSWHGFAAEIVRQLGAASAVEPVTTAEAPRPAHRPAYSALDTGTLNRLIGRPLPPWQDALARYLRAPCGS
jgi:dTDP-4-dehydrorhamnose reductase